MKPIVVLNEPQDLVNIAVVMRAMLNFGLPDLRLVSPAEEFDLRRVEGIAHKSGTLARRVKIHDSLPDAIEDCTHVYALTARGRTVKRNVQRPAEAAEEIVSFPDDHRVALLFGREDKGLTNEELDLCQRAVTIPTTDEFPSLNLSQAATVMMYAWFTAVADPPFKRPRRDAPPATREEMEMVFADAERALESIEFFKSRTKTAIMRTVREVLHRGALDQREMGLARAMFREVIHYLERKGIPSP
jgi:tRNA/rRNA methyltransferase